MLLFALTACFSPQSDNGAPAPDPSPVVQAQRPAPLSVQMVKPAERDPKWANARCNDGTPFGYTLRRTQSKAWVVRLGGGYFCDDGATRCSARAAHYTTPPPTADGSKPPPQATGLHGRTEADNPLFHDANFVVAHYCSSDFWLGEDTERQATTGDPERGWYFAGRNNIDAMLGSLKTLGLDDSDPQTHVLVVGASAGGIGLVGNLDAFGAALPNGVEGGRVKAIHDGAWRIRPPEAYKSVWPGDKWGPFHKACAAHMTLTGENPNDCGYSSIVWPWVNRSKIPTLVQMSSEDHAAFPKHKAGDADFVALWTSITHTELSALPSVFSVAKPYHTLAFTKDLYRGPPGKSFGDSVQRFWETGEPEMALMGYEDPSNAAP
ncbi:MAG: hypothetical protein GWP91_09475 [Rhodobacterales bacterium]|nr:hypothetical protein [Rhodobacterales bacterium]